jgi:translocator protein
MELYGSLDVISWETFHLILSVGLCLAVGGLSGGVTAGEIKGWYSTLKKPSWTPPNWLFPIAWSTLYVLMGIALWLLWENSSTAPQRGWAIALFLLQLTLNAAWSPVFFLMHRTRSALAIILLMAVAIALTMLTAWPVNPTVSWLLAPYLVWVAYASTVNAGVVALNP